MSRKTSTYCAGAWNAIIHMIHEASYASGTDLLSLARLL